MKLKHQKIGKRLMQHNIKPSYQRIRILDYMANNLDHPTAERIYNDLLPEIPTLSKTTVYNSLRLFIEAGILQAVNLGDHETHYDYIVEDHGHFKCIHCGSIYDFTLGNDVFKNNILIGFRIKEKYVYCKGICPKCLDDKTNESRR